MNIRKYFYIVTGFLSISLSVALELKDRHVESLILFLITVLSVGIGDILDELKNNEDVIIRDPKTGRFKKK